MNVQSYKPLDVNDVCTSVLNMQVVYTKRSKKANANLTSHVYFYLAYKKQYTRKQIV